MLPKSLFENAVASIEMGIEDSQSSDARRSVSAVRNLFAGVVLLMKECLHRVDPKLVFNKFEPVLDTSGNVVLSVKGQTTIDYRELQSRWKRFVATKARPFDWARLTALQKIRNDSEHFVPKVDHKAMQVAIANTYVLITALFDEHLGLEPVDHFDASIWQMMVSEAETYSRLSKAAKRNRVDSWLAPVGSTTAFGDYVECPDCGSSLLNVEGSEPYPETTLRCRACGERCTVRSVLPPALHAQFAGDRYLAAKDGDDDPLGVCPHCGEEAYLVEEDQCQVCEEGRAYTECSICGQELDLDEQDFDGLCGVHYSVIHRDD